jgi:hypothetical protein
MGDRRGSQFVFEALFLIALATALAFAHLHAYEIAGGMLLGWLVVAALEWATWRGRPHYGSGVPPRYYVPTVNLPPAQPLEQVRVGYPEAARDEAPTWIAPAELRAEVLGEWPSAVTPPPEPEPEPDPEPEPEPEDEEPEFVAPGADDADPWTVAELPAEPGEEREPVAAGEGALARYHLEPLADPAPRRRFGRRSDAEGEPIEVPARPRGARRLPGAAAESKD